MSKNVRIVVLPGGTMPERQSEGAIGFDVFLRAIVSPTEMDQKQPHLRKTLFDFTTIPQDRTIEDKISEEGGELFYEMDPQESVLCGIGFITEMPFPMFYWVAPRSGLSSKYGITVTNSPGTVDPDYRGEAGVLLYNRNDHPFRLRRNMRIAQIIFQEAIIPDLKKVRSLGDLNTSKRGSGGFGSTGV